MIVLRVEELKQKAREISFSEGVAEFAPLLQAEQSGDCTFVSPVTGTLAADWEFDHARVTGSVSARVRLSCARCLADFERDVAAAFVVYYTEAVSGAEPDDEIELAEHDLLSASYLGDEIHVNQEISEQLLMALPVKPLCDDRCQGLCQGCGRDLNKEKCACEGATGSLAFGALKHFTVTCKGD